MFHHIMVGFAYFDSMCEGVLVRYQFKMSRLVRLVTLFFFLIPMSSYAQPRSMFEKARLTVADGLPQSYISGLVQDRQNFIWVGTRDGLARYDGRNFKVFLNKRSRPNTLASNVILSLFLDQDDKLWIHYQSGDIDIFDTLTENIIHFTHDPVYRACFSSIKPINGIIRTGPSKYWLLHEKGGIFVVELDKHKMRFYQQDELGLINNPITGMSLAPDGAVALVTDTALIQMGKNLEINSIIPYGTAIGRMFNPRRYWKDNAPIIRKDGSWVIIDEDRVIIYDLPNRRFMTRPMPSMKLYVPPRHVVDSDGTVLFSFNGFIYSLTMDNRLVKWLDKGPFKDEGITSMLYDRSGVLWLGTNGYDLRSIDLRIPRIVPRPYSRSFPEDVLLKDFKVRFSELQHSPIYEINPYLFRWALDRNGKLWMTKAGPDLLDEPNLCYYQNGRIIQRKWKYTDTFAHQHTRINSLAFSSSGKLFGVDFFLRIIAFDTLRNQATVKYRIPLPDRDKVKMVNSMIVDGEGTFWIITNRGLLRYHAESGKILDMSGAFQLKDLTVMVNDTRDRNILWIGSLGGGLISFNKKTLRYRVFTTDDGLPNNTIYAIIPHGNALWCSSNKGIFSFEPKTGHVSSYTVLDGLSSDEFNQQHFFHLLDGRLAFGGTKDYVIFDPKKIGVDHYAPNVVLTGLKINYKNADFGTAEGMILQSINSLDTLRLSYRANFLSFDFAALEYNMPAKLRYRFQLTNVDKQWVDSENGTATYTDLNPGRYTFRVNATNAAGKWSPHTKILKIIITPPFWQTWWFTGLVFSTSMVLAYLVIRFRVLRFREQEKQKLLFQRQVIDLETKALRAQMNPHFIFNCLNSIKALIQETRNSEAVTYLNVFSKLVRSKIGNVHHDISLADELQTCKLYVQLESIRFGEKVQCHFLLNDNIDPHAVNIPPLLLQPLIENAIWHGILPSEREGEILVRISEVDDYIECVVEDNGIGRLLSLANRPAHHEARGLGLIANRLKLYNGSCWTPADMQIFDGTDAKGDANGTVVVLKIRCACQ